jgi:hypothetical protein
MKGNKIIMVDRAVAGITLVRVNGKLFGLPLKYGNSRRSNINSIWRFEPCAKLRYLWSVRRFDLYACLARELGACRQASLS